MVTYLETSPATALQLPLSQLDSTTAMTFCIKTDGTELMTALNTMQKSTTGSMTG